MLRTHNNTDGNKLVIFTCIALYYCNNYILLRRPTSSYCIVKIFGFVSSPVRKPQPQRAQFGSGGGGGVVPVTTVFPEQPGGGVQPRVSQEGVPQQTAAFGTCIMPGCPFPKRIEGDTVHEYCSRTCAQKHRAMPASGHMQNPATAQQYGMWLFLC